MKVVAIKLFAGCLALSLVGFAHVAGAGNAVPSDEECLARMLTPAPNLAKDETGRLEINDSLKQLQEYMDASSSNIEELKKDCKEEKCPNARAFLKKAIKLQKQKQKDLLGEYKKSISKEIQELQGSAKDKEGNADKLKELALAMKQLDEIGKGADGKK